MHRRAYTSALRLFIVFLSRRLRSLNYRCNAICYSFIFMQTMDCHGCKWSNFAFCTMCENKEELLQFLQNHNVIKKIVNCDVCGTPATFDNNRDIWRCQKINKKRIGKKVKTIKCNFHVSLLRNTWFENSHLPLKTACQFISNYLYLDPPHQVKLEHEFNLSAHTVVD